MNGHIFPATWGLPRIYHWLVWFSTLFFLFARILEGVETCPTDHQPVIAYGLITFEVQVATQFFGAQNCDLDPSLDADIA